VCLAVSCGSDDSDRDGENSAGDGGNAGSPEGGDGGTNSAGANDGGASASGGEGASDGNAGAGASVSEGGAGGDPSVPSKDVHGKVTFRGAPRASLPVVVNGVITNTDDDGEFSVPDVDDQYDVLIFNPEEQLAQVIQGLTTRNPLIDSYLAPDPELNQSASLSGALSGGGGFPNPANHRAQVAFVGAQIPSTSMIMNEGMGGGFSFSKSWVTEESLNGTLFALQWSWDADGLTALTGYASKPFTLEDGATYASPETDLALVAIDQHLASVEVDWQDYSAATCTAYVGPIKMEFTPCDGSFSVPTPDDLPWRTFVSLRGGSAGDHYATVRAQVPETGDLAVVFPKPRNQLLPVDGATGVDVETAFTWSTSEPEMGGVHQFSCAGGWEIELTSAETAVSIPDLSEYGLALPKATECQWFLNAVGPASSADELVALRYAFANQAELPSYKQSDGGTARTFTTAE
jgi:hypothetical protein